jgi:hypothetical protein
MCAAWECSARASGKTGPPEAACIEIGGILRNSWGRHHGCFGAGARRERASIAVRSVLRGPAHTSGRQTARRRGIVGGCRWRLVASAQLRMPAVVDDHRTAPHRTAPPQNPGNAHGPPRALTVASASSSLANDGAPSNTSTRHHPHGASGYAYKPPHGHPPHLRRTLKAEIDLNPHPTPTAAAAQLLIRHGTSQASILANTATLLSYPQRPS